MSSRTRKKILSTNQLEKLRRPKRLLKGVWKLDREVTLECYHSLDLEKELTRLIIEEVKFHDEALSKS